MPTPALRAQIQAGTLEQHDAKRFLRHASVAAVLALTAMILSVTIARRARVARTQLALSTAEVGRVVREAELAALDRETAVRGYLITRDERSLEPETRGRVLLGVKLDTLYSLTADRPAQQERVAGIRRGISEWEQTFAAPAVASARRSATTAISDSSLAGKSAFDAVRRQFDAFVRENDALYTDGVAEYERTSSVSAIALFVEFLVLVALVFLMRSRLRHQMDRFGSQHQALVDQNNLMLEQHEEMEAQAIELELTLQEAQESGVRLQTVTQRLVEAQRIAQIGSWETDFSTGETFWSDEMYVLLGADPIADVASFDTLLERVLPDDRKRVSLEAREAVESGKAFNSEFCILRSGRSMTMYARGRLQEDSSGRSRLTGTLQDISERKRSEHVLRETSELLHTLLDSSPLAVIATDSDLRVLVWNPAAERLFGWTAAEVMGEITPLASGPFADDSVTILRRVQREGRVVGVRAQRPRKDGSAADVSISIAQYYDAAGAVAGYMVVVADLTDRLRLENQLRQSQKMEAVGQLAGGVAHDFNNLLTVILSYADMLRAASTPDDDDHLALGEIQDAANRAAGLTRQLLAFSRQQVLRPHVLDLNEGIERLEKMLVRLVGENITIHSHLDPELGRVRADPGQIDQVLVNLAVNARDAMPSGGTLTIETANVDIDEAFLRQNPAIASAGGYAMITVSDNGTGMSREVRDRIFEPFFTTKQPGDGTGLGLSTVHGIVEQSGGHIFVYSELGFGTTFKIYLPHHDAPEQTEVDTRPAPTEMGGKESILLVEDEEAVRRVAAMILNRGGYTVIEAENGAAALQLCERDDVRIDLVITDVVMPHMGGRDLAREIRRRRPGARVAFMSGYTRTTLTADDMGEGSVFIEKPFSAETLLGAIRALIDSPTRAG